MAGPILTSFSTHLLVSRWIVLLMKGLEMKSPYNSNQRSKPYTKLLLQNSVLAFASISHILFRVDNTWTQNKIVTTALYNKHIHNGINYMQNLYNKITTKYTCMCIILTSSCRIIKTTVTWNAGCQLSDEINKI